MQNHVYVISNYTRDNLVKKDSFGDLVFKKFGR